jgi:hypothetical protein
VDLCDENHGGTHFQGLFQGDKTPAGLHETLGSGYGEGTVPTTLLLTVKSYEFEAGANTQNQTGLMIRGKAADKDNQSFDLRIYFYLPDQDTKPQLVGWRAVSDGALVIFLQRRDFGSYVQLLGQQKATYIKVQIEGPSDDITSFELSTAPFPAGDQLQNLIESDAAEYQKRVAR